MREAKQWLTLSVTENVLELTGGPGGGGRGAGGWVGAILIGTPRKVCDAEGEFEEHDKWML